MTRETISLEIKDLKQFAKALRAELPNTPSHVETLGLVARAAGYRNFQHLRAQNTPKPVADDKLVARALEHFDDKGQLKRWPGKTRIQGLCLWVLWARLPARQTLTERDISGLIDAMTLFRDAAQIRRGMIEHAMLTRNLDGSAYERVEQLPPPEALALIAKLAP
ncbi:DUF2087 domain-containing protein [uncultured Pelagimonas sp.]|uniref:DUF2087 domain-containing protein n=1 Tax=uncultured Pelagimonas sp. TaxID=1618102 RepID=UPI002623E773|nr:DUF2087 domain-containing protein [uncultured Pelagimonas sp.]